MRRGYPTRPSRSSRALVGKSRVTLSVVADGSEANGSRHGVTLEPDDPPKHKERADDQGVGERCLSFIAPVSPLGGDTGYGLSPDKVHLTHTPRSEQPQDGVARKRIPLSQRHAGMLTRQLAI